MNKLKRLLRENIKGTDLHEQIKATRENIKGTDLHEQKEKMFDGTDEQQKKGQKKKSRGVS